MSKAILEGVLQRRICVLESNI